MLLIEKPKLNQVASGLYYEEETDCFCMVGWILHKLGVPKEALTLDGTINAGLEPLINTLNFQEYDTRIDGAKARNSQIELDKLFDLVLRDMENVGVLEWDFGSNGS